MARDFFINGATMVSVKGRSDSLIPALTQLGLPDQPIRIRPDVFPSNCNVDAWGDAPADVQVMMGACTIITPLIHVDTVVLRECLRLGMGGPTSWGQTARAGIRLGNNLPRFAPVGTLDSNGVSQPGNNYIGLNILSPVGGIPYRFLYAYMTGPPYEWPLGAEKSVVAINWRAIPYTQDPWGGSASQPATLAGFAGQNAYIWDSTLDT